MAVWQCAARRLFLARDRIGVKPLFYAKTADGMIFGSEIKTILADRRIKPQLDVQGAAQILLLGPGRIPGSGVFKGIDELEPGHWAVFEDGQLRVKQYWKLTDREHTESLEETLDHIRWLVTDAIRRQMVSDVPIGCFLSGGLDSSIICAVCSKEIDGIATFSVDYQDNDRYFQPGKFQPNTDNAYIDLMVRTLGSRHHRCVLTPAELLQYLPAATEARDLPGMADVDFSLNAFCGRVREQVKVALSGECADEIFGGYPWYRDPKIRAVDGFPWAQNTTYRASMLNPDVLGNIDPVAFVQDRYRQSIAEADILPGTSEEEKRMKQLVYLNQRWFMQTLLDRKDRMSMYCGLEVRVPFCDYRIAEYLYSVPWAYKDHNGYEKGLLRTAMNGLLPEDVLWRKKSPYPKTYDPGYLNIVSSWLKRILDDPNAPLLQLVRREALEQLIIAEYTWPWYGQLMKVPQTIAYMLQIDHWLRKYRISLV
jgi:asparagine synthase (glutamine-hydrolysing)